MGEAALTRRAREAGLDRLDDARSPVRDHQQGIAEAAPAHVLEEGAHRLRVLLGASHQVQQDLGAAHGEAPGRQHRLAPLTRPDALGNAVHEQVGDVVLRQIPLGELLVVRPLPLTDLGHRRARQQQPTALVPESILDVAHAQAPRQKLHRQALERLGAALQALPDLRAEGLIATGDLRRRVVHQPLRRLQTAHAHAVAPALARRRAVLVIVAAEYVSALRLQRLLDDKTGRQLHQSGTPVRRRQRPSIRSERDSRVRIDAGTSLFATGCLLAGAGGNRHRSVNPRRGCTPTKISGNSGISPITNARTATYIMNSLCPFRVFPTALA